MKPDSTTQPNQPEYSKDDCIIFVEPYALGNIRLTAATDIFINGIRESNPHGWTLQEIIERAAYQPDPVIGKGYADWHDQIFLEVFEQEGLNFTLVFGS